MQRLADGLRRGQGRRPAAQMAWPPCWRTASSRRGSATAICNRARTAWLGASLKRVHSTTAVRGSRSRESISSRTARSSTPLVSMMVTSKPTSAAVKVGDDQVDRARKEKVGIAAIVDGLETVGKPGLGRGVPIGFEPDLAVVPPWKLHRVQNLRAQFVFGFATGNEFSEEVATAPPAIGCSFSSGGQSGHVTDSALVFSTDTEGFSLGRRRFGRRCRPFGGAQVGDELAEFCVRHRLDDDAEFRSAPNANLTHGSTAPAGLKQDAAC